MPRFQTIAGAAAVPNLARSTSISPKPAGPFPKRCLRWSKGVARQTSHPSYMPGVVSQPARAPLARSRQAQFNSAATAKRTVVRQQPQLAGLSVALIDHRNRALLLRRLTVVDSAEVQHVTMRHLVARLATTLQNRPTPLDLAILATFAVFQEHAPMFTRSAFTRIVGRSGLTSENRLLKITDLRYELPPKSPFCPPCCGRRASFLIGQAESPWTSGMPLGQTNNERGRKVFSFP